MNFLFDLLKGIMIGIANAIPGVSGGTMMVSMGIYDKIIGSVTGIFKHLKASIMTLLPYAIGMGVGIIGLSYGIKYLLGSYPFQTSMLFIGLILGGLPILLSHVKGKSMDFSKIMIFLFFFAMIILLQLAGGKESVNYTISVSFAECIKLFGIGVIAAATMVIPGVSGSMILMLLGYYYPIITTITEAIEALKNFNMGELIRVCSILIPFGLGVVIGIFLIAKIIEWLLKNFEGHTYSGILGLVAASPAAILMENGLPPMDVLIILSGILAFVIGGGIAFFLGKE